VSYLNVGFGGVIHSFLCSRIFPLQFIPKWNKNSYDNAQNNYKEVNLIRRSSEPNEKVLTIYIKL